jgi:hypothetical protein
MDAPQDVRMVATDVDWAYGAGEEIRSPMHVHLLTLTVGGSPWQVVITGVKTPVKTPTE